MVKISHYFYYILIWGQKMYLFFEKSAYHKKYLFAALLQQKPCFLPTADSRDHVLLGNVVLVVPGVPLQAQ